MLRLVHTIWGVPTGVAACGELQIPLQEKHAMAEPFVGEIRTVGFTNGRQPSPSPSTFLGATGSRGEGTPVYCTPAQQSVAPATMLPTAVGAAGNSQPHNNMGPYVVLNFCIALQGIFPQRP